MSRNLPVLLAAVLLLAPASRAEDDAPPELDVRAAGAAGTAFATTTGIQRTLDHAEGFADSAAQSYAWPPFSHFRSDYNSPTKGTAANPLDLRPCALSAVDWQTEMCAGIASAPRAYPQSYSLNAGQGWDKYWVLHVNDEPAFVAERGGPPSQSMPVNVGGAATVTALPDGFSLGINSESKPKPGGNLFLGYGLQTGRGAGSRPIVPNAKYLLSFEVTLDELQGAPNMGDSVHFFVETQGKGGRRFTWLFLGEKNTGASAAMSWNWPIADSMWYPGAQIDMDTAAGASAKCGLALPQIAMSAGARGRTYKYVVDLEKLLACESGLPATTAITGIHFAVEMNTHPLNVVRASFRKPWLRPKPVPRRPLRRGNYNIP